MIKLTLQNGSSYRHGMLYRPATKKEMNRWDDEYMILLYRYPEGDVDHIRFPFEEDKWKQRLAECLFDEREMGNIPADTKEVMLPDGTIFVIDEH